MDGNSLRDATPMDGNSLLQLYFNGWQQFVGQWMATVCGTIDGNSLRDATPMDGNSLRDNGWLQFAGQWMATVCGTMDGSSLRDNGWQQFAGQWMATVCGTRLQLMDGNTVCGTGLRSAGLRPAVTAKTLGASERDLYIRIPRVTYVRQP